MQNILSCNTYINYNKKYFCPDCPKHNFDKTHFGQYPKKIHYNFNSKGFRDNEWPSDLSNAIWCIGDSFTVGIGQPFDEIWPSQLQYNSKQNTINISETGCSNDRIAQRVKEIHARYNPKVIVVMWSYFHRRMVDGVDVQYDRTHFGAKQDLENFSKNFESVCSLSGKQVHMVIPNPFLGGENYQYFIENKIKPNKLFFVKQLDTARDGFHFDALTSNSIVEFILNELNLT